MRAGAAERPSEAAHIVVVDDEAAAREMVRDYLCLHGYAVTACDGGRSLRSLLREGTPDLIVLDLNMPEEDGLSLIRFVKQSTAIPVVLLTATASPIDRVVGLEMGADDYLAKPCELRELLARIRSVLRRTRWSSLQVQERRLAAIVSFDQVGFSRAVQEDEPATLATMDRVFADIIGPSLPAHRGTLFKTLGDGALIEFGSIVYAVQWAVTFQRAVFEMRQRIGGRPLSFRLGIAIGDIVETQADRHGEGVALAVRVQEAGRPGAVTLSDYAYVLARARVGERFTDLGTRALNNIELPMRLWEWMPGAA